MDIDKKAKLLSLYRDSAEFRALIVALSGYERNMSCSLLRTIVEKFPDDGRPLSAKSAAARSGFRDLGELGFGRLIIGRRGAETRFEWSVPMQDVLAQLPQTGDSQPVPPEQGDHPVMRTPSVDSGGSDVVDVAHRFVLRRDFTVEVSLPVDLTAAEADRLASFVRTLPFEGEHE